MSGTTAFEAKGALVDLLRATPYFADDEETAIWYGYQGSAGNMPRRVVWVGEIEWTSEDPSALGGMKRVEEYRILVTIESHFPGDSQEEANARVEADMTVLEGLLRDRNPLGLDNPESVGIEPQLLGEGQDADGRGAILVTSVRVRARK